MPTDLQSVVQRMVEAGESEDNIRLVIEHYGPTKTATAPPVAATRGMRAPDTATSPAPTGTLMDLIPPREQRHQDMARMIDSVGAAIPLNVPGIVAGTKQVPGVLARAGGISKARAGANIEEAMNAAKQAGVTVDVAKTADKGLRAVELKAAKFRVPQAVTAFMERATSPNGLPHAAQEVHDFASNLSEQSINEANAVKKPVRRIVTQMSKQARQDLIDALNAIGKGDQYASGVNEYARAAKTAKYAGNAAKVATAAGTGYLGLGWLKQLMAN